jgi:hypothetical protein
MTKLIPYSVYLPSDVYEKIRALAKERKASSAVRDAITLIMQDGDLYRSGYRKGIDEAIKIINNCKEIENIAVNNKYLADALIDQLMLLVEQ